MLGMITVSPSSTRLLREQPHLDEKLVAFPTVDVFYAFIILGARSKRSQ